MTTWYFDSRNEEEQVEETRLCNCLMRTSHALESDIIIIQARSSFGLGGIPSFQRIFDSLQFGRNCLYFCFFFLQLASLRLEFIFIHQQYRSHTRES